MKKTQATKAASLTDRLRWPFADAPVALRHIPSPPHKLYVLLATATPAFAVDNGFSGIYLEVVLLQYAFCGKRQSFAIHMNHPAAFLAF
jgi:hypothetical protein